MASPDPLLLGKAPAPVAANHPRSVVLSALLALMCPGLGHFYCGAVRPALVWALLPLVAVIALLAAGTTSPDRLHLFAAGGLAAWVALRLLQTVFAARLAARLPRYTLRPFNHPALYLSFFLGTSIAGSLLARPLREFLVEPFKVADTEQDLKLLPGDNVFIVKSGPGAQVHRGDLVAVRNPALGPSLLRRVALVHGDNLDGTPVPAGRFLVIGPTQFVPVESDDLVGDRKSVV